MEEGTVEQKPQTRWQRWKRILLVSVLLAVLAGSLIYYVVPRFFSPLRRDPVPSDAYIIPWMQPNPSIEELKSNSQLPHSPPPFDIDVVMANALKLNMTFTITIPDVIIDTPEGKVHIYGETRVVSSTLYLGHDLNYLYVGGKFSGMYTNPASTDKVTVPNYLSILFDVTNDGVLKQPESGSRLSAYIQISDGTGGSAYHDMMWAYSSQDKKEIWIMADNYYDLYLHRAQPDVALGNAIKEYDNSTGTLIILFSRYLWQSASYEMNALQMRPGERWVMGFLFELGYATNSPAGNYVDGWPKKIYPYLSSDSSWWPKLVIDLTNPPPEFST